MLSATTKSAKPGLSLSARPESLTRSVFEAIRGAIIDKTLEPGMRVTEASLAEQLNVSKTPVREALLELRQAGLIEDWGRRGGRIISPSAKAITEVGELREAVEVYLAGAVAERSAPAARRQIMELAQRCLVTAKKQDGVGFHELNLAFHLAFADALDNRMLRRSVDNILTLSALLRMRDFPKLSPLMDFAAGHVAIAEAVLDGDRIRAEKAARDHVHHSLNYNLGAFREFEQRSQRERMKAPAGA